MICLLLKFLAHSHWTKEDTCIWWETRVSEPKTDIEFRVRRCVERGFNRCRWLKIKTMQNMQLLQAVSVSRPGWSMLAILRSVFFNCQKSNSQPRRQQQESLMVPMDRGRECGTPSWTDFNFSCSACPAQQCKSASGLDPSRCRFPGQMLWNWYSQFSFYPALQRPPFLPWLLLHLA